MGSWRWRCKFCNKKSMRWRWRDNDPHGLFNRGSEYLCPKCDTWTDGTKMDSSEKNEISWVDIITQNEYDILTSGLSGEIEWGVDIELEEEFDKIADKFGNIFRNVVGKSAHLKLPADTVRKIIQKGLTIFIKDENNRGELSENDV